LLFRPRQQFVYLRDGEHLGQRPPRLRAGDDAGGIVGAQGLGAEEAVELADGRQLSCAAGGGEPLGRQFLEIAEYLLSFRGQWLRSAPMEVGGVAGKIPAIG